MKDTVIIIEISIITMNIGIIIIRMNIGTEVKEIDIELMIDIKGMIDIITIIVIIITKEIGDPMIERIMKE